MAFTSKTLCFTAVILVIMVAAQAMPGPRPGPARLARAAEKGETDLKAENSFGYGYYGGYGGYGGPWGYGGYPYSYGYGPYGYGYGGYGFDGGFGYGYGYPYYR